MAASSQYRSQTAFGAYLRKMKSRKGPVQAITSLGHKMARTIYQMMSNKQSFRELGADYYDKLYKERTLKYLRKKAASLGYCLSETSKTGEAQMT